MKFDLKKATKHFEASKLTKTQLSEKLHLHQSSVGDWFLGRNDPSQANIIKLAKVLKVKVEDITVDETKKQVMAYIRPHFRNTSKSNKKQLASKRELIEAKYHPYSPPKDIIEEQIENIKKSLITISKVLKRMED